MTTPTPITRILLLILLLAAGAGCANLERNLQDPAVWQRIAEINDRYAERQRQIDTGVYGGENEVIDLTGDWTFVHKGRSNTNRIRHGHGGIMVMPIGRNNSPVFYEEVGINLYRSDDGATYRFTTIHTGTWRSRNNTVIQLRRATWQ